MPIKMSGSNSILWICAVLLLAGCAGKQSLPDTLSGAGKTPLVIEASLCSESDATKADNSQFENNDVLLAYLRHTTGGAKGNYTVLNHANATNPTKSIALKKTANGFESVSTNNYSINSPLYWDDFSNSAYPETDLRTSGHGLQSYYGYCYNGGTPSTALNASEGTLGWTVLNNQRGSNCQHSDLLWSQEQETVSYTHGTSRNDAAHTLAIPFTHAMSEITVTVNANLGFGSVSSQWQYTSLTLNSMNTVASLTAPSGTVSGSTTGNIIMHAGDPYSDYRFCTFTAIIAPDTKLKVGEKLLDITNLDGNNYEVLITDEMIDAEKWAYNHDISVEGGKDYILSKSGYNYHLHITVNKAEVLASATLDDWADVNATGDGDILFSNDEQSVVISDDNYVDDASFSLFRYHGDNPGNSTYEYATIATWDGSQWTNSPAIYWPNKNDSYYFRALAQYNGLTESKKSISSVGDRNDEPVDKGTVISQAGNDILWGTTAQHTGPTTAITYTAGQYLPPRTGIVPLTFRHALSKVSFTLTTPEDGSAVNLSGATIAVTNLYTQGTINLHDGSVTGSSMNTETETLASAAISNRVAPISNLLVIPQTIGDDTQVIITLADAVYRLPLNECQDSESETIGTWVGGKDYTYTLTVAKEMVSSSVLVQDWTVIIGSGSAQIDW